MVVAFPLYTSTPSPLPYHLFFHCSTLWTQPVEKGKKNLTKQLLLRKAEPEKWV
jgi:hypothetical protein